VLEPRAVWHATSTDNLDGSGRASHHDAGVIDTVGEPTGGSVARTGKFLIKTGRGGKTHFVLVATNGRVVATSETYESKESCLKGVSAVKRLAADAVVVEEAAASSNAQRDRKTSPPKPAAASY
jgi:uncharacterized protein YegP (UPF0339 family)